MNEPSPAHRCANRWLILADDLTGAADAASPFARRGLRTAVGWGAVSNADRDDASVFSFDTDTRRASAAAAAAQQRTATLGLLAPGDALYKKIDSTLRGQPAAEIAALCAMLRGLSRAAYGVFAPANPAMGRTTVGGHVLVNGEPLERSEIWSREHSYPRADLEAILAGVGLRVAKLPLSTVRTVGALRAAFDSVARESGARDDGLVILCDAETDQDLEHIASAAGHGGDPGFFIGTAGLAKALAMRIPASPRACGAVAATRQGALIVVGSLASIAGAAADQLAAVDGVRRVRFPPGTLLDDSQVAQRTQQAQSIAMSLDAGEDVLVEIARDAAPDLSAGPALARQLALCLLPAMRRMSALIATGGETAAALLSACEVRSMSLVDEIETGISLGLARGAIAVPVVTKPGAFSDAHSLVRSLGRLRHVRHSGILA